MKKRILEMYFEKQMRPIDISKELNIAQYTITRVIQKDDRYLNEKQTRKNKNKIKNREETKTYIKNKRKAKQFKNNVDDLVLKNMHNQASIELSNIKKLSNMAYRNWNKSAYTYNEKRKGFEFKEKLGRSYDVPKFIKVEL